MVSVNVDNREELEFALAYLIGALPCRPKGIALLTLNGELVGQVMARHDAQQVDLLLRAARSVTCDFVRAMGNGEFRYNLNVGADGALLTVLLDGHYLVAINVREVRSVDAFISAVREGLPPLRDALGLRA